MKIERLNDLLQELLLSERVEIRDYILYLENQLSGFKAQYNTDETIINQLEADKLEMAKGYIELAENSDYNHDVFILAKEYIKEVEK